MYVSMRDLSSRSQINEHRSSIRGKKQRIRRSSEKKPKGPPRPRQKQKLKRRQNKNQSRSE